jgi:WD40 repeat protein
VWKTSGPQAALAWRCGLLGAAWTADNRPLAPNASANPTQCSVLSGHNGWVSDATLSHDGAHCVTASADGTACVWDTATGHCERRLQGHSGEVRGWRAFPGFVT